MKCIQFSHVGYSYGEEGFAVKDLSFELEKGSYVALVGHNGSGKSTIAKLIIGLLPLHEGEIRIHGLKLNKKNLSTIRSKIGIVFQNPDNQFIGSTVEDDIAFGLENRNVPQEKMQDIINTYAEKVGMKDYLKKEPTNLSGGQKQRVAIAGILAIQPEIIIFDEATSMLDPRGKREVAKIIKEMRKTMPGLTIISITHDVEEAYLADKVILMDHGEIKALDTPDNIFNNEELIKKYHLKRPFLLEIKRAGKKAGFDLDEIRGIKEAADKICR